MSDKTIVSVSEAAGLVRKGRQTLYDHRDKGKLSFTKNAEGKTGIDVSELVRVYGKLYVSSDNAHLAHLTPTDTKPVQGTEASLQAELEREQSERARDRKENAELRERCKWLEGQVEYSQKQVVAAQLQLTDQREKHQAVKPKRGFFSFFASA